MAQRVVTELTDDLDGSTLADGDGETVTFSIDGVTTEIDLSKKNADKLRKTLRAYVDAGRKVSAGSGRRRSTTKSTSNGESKAIHDWAAQNGIEISARGRIPKEIKDQYASAN